MILLPRYEPGTNPRNHQQEEADIFCGVDHLCRNQPEPGPVEIRPFDSALLYLRRRSLPLEVKETERLTGCRLVEGYGLSETAPVATCNAMADTNKPGSIDKSCQA